VTWDAGTTRLKIINDLLDAANYFSLWCDGHGRYRATKYQAPKDRTPIYRAQAPLVAGESSLFSPDWEDDHDIYGVPNRYVAIQTGDGDDEGLTAVATNEDPDSRFSFDARGRWITEVEDGVEATGQAALDAYAERKLAAATDVESKISISHVYLADLLVNEVVEFSAGDLDGILTTVTNTEVTLDPAELVKTKLRKVVR
jgi:hypothetical protein